MIGIVELGILGFGEVFFYGIVCILKLFVSDILGTLRALCPRPKP